MLPGASDRSRINEGRHWEQSEGDIVWSMQRSQRKIPVPAASTLGLSLFRIFATAKK